MLWTSLKRILRSGFVNFWRNSIVSAASIFVMTITLFVIGMALFTQATLESVLTQIRDKVDVNVYFVTSAEEKDILDLKASLESLPEVSAVEYVTREQALAAFRKRHENDQHTLQALEELDENPLGAVLNIKAKDPSQYVNIAAFLERSDVLSKEGTSIIDKINYYQNKVAIDKLTAIIRSSERLGLAITFILVVMSVLITFNTIRLAIYIARDEISVMRLVGASNAYVRGPFVVEGIMTGIFSAIIALALFYPLTYWIGPSTENFFSGLNLFDYYMDTFSEFVLIIMGSGILLGAFSSFLAVKKYLKA
jgi:cell division transport system permease protein